MSYLLVTNDDGVDSPALVPLVQALRRIDRVEVVVPDRERSWISKAISRHDPLTVEQVTRGDDVAAYAVSGYPADCVQLGVHNFFEDRPRLVVSGVNIGSNHGSAFASCSGTIGAAAEAANAGVPALAFSARSTGSWPEWVQWAWSPEAVGMWERMAAIAADIVEVILAEGFPPGVDVVNVNMPHEADLTTERRVTRLAATRYGPLFAPAGEFMLAHAYDGVLDVVGDPAGTDIGEGDAGYVTITPLRFATTGAIDDSLRAALERTPRRDAVV
ncbi:MAG: 5'/3'-nucleotidase SurE [Acidimicrobiia bacterium]|jgi:5'-nucleotidase